MKKIYTCNLCLEQRDPSIMRGLHFSNMTDFTITKPDKTDGTHVCLKCLQQLKTQLNSKEMEFLKADEAL